ncbi:MAG: phosphatase PAP2 family protein [Candidatus Aenigmarchaeota archaeon]|nr:phosphatase PAP2 family protein [Candidatus Aenigmarchaeota archaeon]
MFEYTFWEIITFFGSFHFWTISSLMCLFLFFLIPKKSRKYFVWFIFLVLPSILIANSVTQGLKFIFKIPRPCYGLPYCPSGYSMPSGHTTVAFAALTVLGLNYKGKKYLIPALLFAQLIGISRVILGVHTIPDVLIGSFVGMFVAFLVHKVYEIHYQKFKQIVEKT